MKDTAIKVKRRANNESGGGLKIRPEDSRLVPRGLPSDYKR